MMLVAQLACMASVVGAAVVGGSSAKTSSPVVHLEYASYKGMRLHDARVDQFLGVPFAKPPLNDLRFRAPQEPDYEYGVRDAIKFPPKCLGVNDTTKGGAAEDCLYVNVFKPSNATSRSKLPVWVFIQGGGYRNNDNANYNGTEVVRQSGGNIVYLNFGYRVGVFGFLNSEKVREDGALNAGILDQRFLLHWVQKHISQFGGDPDHVVIHGDSAGGGSVALHMAAYGGNDKENLFVGSIAESPFWPTQRTVGAMEFQYSRLLNATNCDSLNCLRGLSTAVLGNASLEQPFQGAATDTVPNWYWLPVIDGDFIQDHLYSQFQDGRFKRVPMLIGDTTNEGSIFAPNASSKAEFLSFMNSNYPRLQDWQLSLVSQLYSQTPPERQRAAYFAAASAAYGDATFTCPGNTMSNAVSSFVGRDKTWNYRTNIQDPEWIDQGLGVPHVGEICAVYGPKMAPGYLCLQSLENINAPMVPVVMAYFTSFVQFLNPNTRRDPDSPVWENWGSVGTGYGKRIRWQTNSTAMEQVPAELVQKCLVWKVLAEFMDQ